VSQAAPQKATLRSSLRSVSVLLSAGALILRVWVLPWLLVRSAGMRAFVGWRAPFALAAHDAAPQARHMSRLLAVMGKMQRFFKNASGVCGKVL